MEYIKIVMRIILFYFFIILIYRLMGKREVGQLGIIDLIVSILIADLVMISVTDTSKSIMVSIIPILSLVFLEISLSFLSLKSEAIRTLLDGKPTFIIKNGKLNYRMMVKQKYNLDDLLTQLREKGERNIENIEYAILENNGTLSVFPYNIKKHISPLPLPIILDGKMQYDVLRELNKKEEEIVSLLSKKNLMVADIFYGFYKNKSFFVIKRDDLK